MNKIIAIDGPSGAGKSTIARELSARLGYEYLDTGAFYRAVALKLKQSGIGQNASDQQIGDVLRDTRFEFTDGELLLDTVSVSTAIRTPEIGMLASVFSARKVVRDSLISVIRTCVQDKDVVAEGRDTTTVVFPQAWLKLYITASTDVRVRRRFKQLRDYQIETDLHEATDDIIKRDQRDSERELAPLAKAQDAVVIDTSDMDIEEVLQGILRIVADR
ncbi:MAG: (d)CMP kinase [Nitrospirae bacterium]|uniref:(d)CMP kinase n=1 Tax=Candidatus Magnetobacterium casense TaxID=1455061 RepID=UPI00058F5CE7|nr:(d)CMP kinase [Candidatus Magnetobacterium casensis]MBF0338786.1 (d)CMP kinase [Nitrospirota bacterium]